MNTLMQASRQWASRPADERFTSLTDLNAHCQYLRDHSRSVVLANRDLTIEAPDVETISITGPNGHAYEPTHAAFGQLATLAGAPAGYLRTLPAPMAAACVEYGLKYNRAVEDMGVLITRNGSAELRAATGPNYGRVWNSEVTGALVSRFGDGVSGQWKVPGEFGQDVTVTKANTTLYAGDRDMFVFLADEHNRIDVPNRRNGQPGSMARGFFVWNSETGSCTLGAAFFLFDYVCSNRIVWGAEQFREIRIRHTSGAPHRWLEQVAPVLTEYSEASAKPVVQAIEDARARRIPDVMEFLNARGFAKRQAVSVMAAHEADEGRPIETVWDAVTGITALAREIPNQDARVAMERAAGKLMAT
jgi:hypothetical protein